MAHFRHEMRGMGERIADADEEVFWAPAIHGLIKSSDGSAAAEINCRPAFALILLWFWGLATCLRRI